MFLIIFIKSLFNHDCTGYSTLRAIRNLDGILAAYEHAAGSASIKIYGLFTPQVKENIGNIFSGKAIYTVCHLTSFAHKDNHLVVVCHTYSRTRLVAVWTDTGRAIEEFLDVGISEFASIDKKRPSADSSLGFKCLTILRISCRRLGCR